MLTSTQLAVTRPNVNDARCEVLFASGLQPSDAPTADMVAKAITATVRRFGTGGCSGRIAQEFGDHPDAATERMRWVRSLSGGSVPPRDRHRREPGSFSNVFELFRAGRDASASARAQPAQGGKAGVPARSMTG